LYGRDQTRFNYPLLLGSLVVLLVVASGVFFLHSRQQVVSTLRLEKQVDELLAQSNYSEAYSLIKSLVVIKPEDQERKLQLALCADKLATGSQRIQESIRLNMSALGICQADARYENKIPDIRRRLIKRMSEIGNYEDAIDQIGRSVGPEPDLELQRYFTIAKVQMWLDGRTAELSSGNLASLPNWFASLAGLPPVDLLVKSHIEIPKSLDIAGLLVGLCLGDPSKLEGSFLAGETQEALKARAQSIVERLVNDLPEDPYAWLLRYEISSRDSKLGLSESDIEKAVSLSPSDAKILLIAGRLYLERAYRATGLANKSMKTVFLNRAIELFQSARDIQPDLTETHLSIGEVYGLLGDPAKAIETWRDAKRVCSERISLLDFKITAALVGLNRLPDALEALKAMDQDIQTELAYLSRSDQFAFRRQGLESWSRYYLANGEFQSATESLSNVLAGGKDIDAVNQASIYAALGNCYSQMGQFDRAASAYEQSVLLVPNGMEYRRKAASAWFSLGRYTESYKQWLLIEPKEAIDWVKLCDTVLELQRQNGQDSNYWFTFDKGIAEIKRLIALNPDSLRTTWMLEILQIDGNLMRTPSDAQAAGTKVAGEQLWQIVEKLDYQSEPVRAAILRWRAWKQQEYLDKISEKLRSIPDAQQSPAIERAEILATLGSIQEATELLGSKLREQPDSSALKQASLRMELGKMSFDQAIEAIRGLKQGGWFLARKLAWSTLKRPLILSEQEQRDPELRKKRLEARIEELKALEELLKEFEGAEGTEWRYINARRLLSESTDPAKLNSIELLNLVGFLDRKRPEWPETHLLAGLINESQGNASRAIREYNYAIAYGNNELETYERLVNLLYRQGLVSDARIALDRLGNRLYASQQLAAVSLELANESPQDQLKAAELVTQIRPQDPIAWIWLGQIIELQSRDKPDVLRQEEIQKADKIFGKANEVASADDLRVLMARFNFYQLTQNQDGQQSVLTQIEQSQGIEPSVQWVAIGQIHESLGKSDLAVEAYQKAISLGANDLELRTQIARLYLKENRLQDAVECYRETLKRHPQDAATRRGLAVLLANRSLDEDWQQVAELLSPSEKAKAPDDMRLEVMLLSQRNDIESLQKAQYQLERIVELPGVRTNEDYFQLASLYMRTARMLESAPGREIEMTQSQQAAGRLLKLVSSAASPKPEYIYTYADYLIRQKRFFDAVEESQKLLAIDASSFPAVLLKARITKLEGDKEGAKNSILAWLEEKRQVHASFTNRSKLASSLVQAGQGLEILEEQEESRKLLKEAYDLDKRAGVNYIRSILLTDDQTTRNNAVRFMMDRLKTEASKESAVLLSLLIRKGDTDESLIDLAQKQLVDYSVSQKDDKKILQSLADLWIWRSNESQAIETFRRIVQDRPNDVIALNNLAMLLADSPTNTQEALPLINRAIELVGTKAALMDSKAYVLLRLGRYEEAISILSSLLAKDDSPSVRFHLYQAYLKSSQTQLANELLPTIDLAALRKSPLTQSDQKELQQLEKATSKELQ
jgi:tetratricopeptide (TPR) repeat protein